MKITFRAHPTMIFRLLKPFWFVLVIPAVQSTVQYFISHSFSGFFVSEAVAFVSVLIIAVLRCKAYSVTVENETLIIQSGAFFKKRAILKLSDLSSVTTERNPFDILVRAVTYRINTEAGKPGKPDFEFKLSLSDAKMLSSMIFGGENRTVIKFSALKIAILSATTSSAVTGMVIGVPILNKAGKLLGMALSEMLFDEINSVSEKLNTYFPPIVNVITIVFLIAYGFSFFVSLFRNTRFKLLMGKEKLEIESGLIVRKHAVFKKQCINDVCIEQTPLMRLFKRFSMRATVGGYGGSKGEKAVIVPCGRHYELKNQFKIYFPFLKSSGKSLRAARGNITVRRFLWLPRLIGAIIIMLSAVLILAFPYFDRLILFLAVVAMIITIYYGNLCYYNYRFGKLHLGTNLFARGTRRFNSRELYCDKERIGEIRLMRTPADRKFRTCKVNLIVCSESADSVRVQNLPYNETINQIDNCFKLNGIL